MFPPPLLRRRRPPRIALAWAAAAAFALNGVAAAHSPHDISNLIAVSPDFAHDRTVFASFLLTEHKLLGRSTDGGRSWELYAPPKLVEGLTSLDFSPAWSSDRTIFASTHGGGAFRSTDGGDTWHAVNTGLTDLTANDLAVSPDFAQDRTLLVVTDTGCFRSVDGGDTWALAKTGVSSASLPLATVSFATADVAFVGGQVVHRSDDRGQTWTPMQRFIHPAVCVEASPAYAADTTLIACFGSGGDGIRASRDGGRTWVSLADGLTDKFVNQVAFADDGTLFAATRTAGCFRSKGVGSPFTVLTAGFERQSDLTRNHYLGVDASPTYSLDHIVFVTSFEGFFFSRNGGNLWKQADVYSQLINRRVILAKDATGARQILLGNYGGGVFVSRPAPANAPTETITWQARADGLGALWTDVLVASPDYASDGTLLAGHLGLWMSTDRGRAWAQLPLPSSETLVLRAAAFSPQWTVDHTLFAGYGEGGVWRSTDAGKTWALLAGGLPSDQIANFILMSPGWPEDAVGFIATKAGQIFRSSDGGETWSACDGLPGQEVRALALSPAFATDRTALAGIAGGGVFATHNGGDTWTASNAGLPADMPLIVEGLEVSPAFATDGTAFLSLLTGGVYRSTDRGQHWSLVSTDLPLSAPRVLALSPDFAADHTLALTTHDWAWLSKDAGLHWSKLPGFIRVDDSLPDVVYSGRWSRKAVPGFNFVGSCSSEKAGSYTELEFQGRSIEWYSQTGPEEGSVFVRIDGQAEATVSLLATSPTLEAKAFSKTFAEAGWHTIRIVVAGPSDSNPNAHVVTDGFSYSF